MKKSYTGKIRKVLLLISMVALSGMLLIGCGSKKETSGETKESAAKTASLSVGLLFPSQSDARWTAEGENMKSVLEEQGYSVMLLYAEDAASQVSQMEDLVAQDIDGLLVVPMDAHSLTDTLEKARKAKIPVVAYDTLPMDSKGISYYVGYDYEKAGTMIGEYIVEQAGLKELSGKEDKEPKTIEFFLRDNSTARGIQEYNAIMAVLNPYLTDGTLVCESERTSQEDVGVSNSSADIAKEYCSGILAANYADKNLDIVCTNDDTIAAALKDSLESNGYTVGSKWPILTGEGGTENGLKLIASKAQNISISFDGTSLADTCLTVFEACMEDQEPELENAVKYDNGAMKVTSYLEEPKLEQ